MRVEKCKNCAYYTAFYKRWSNHYGRIELGHCSKKKQVQKQLDTCGDFKSNEQKEERKEKMMLEHLERALISIDHISQIMREKEDDKKKGFS